MNLISFHGFVKGKKSTVVVLYCYWWVNYHLEIGLDIIQHKNNNLSIVSYEAKQRIHVIHIQKTDFIMACYTEIYSVENTIKKLHIKSDFHSGYIYNFYRNKQEIIDELFYQYQLPLLKYINHPALIQEWKKN